MADELKYTEPTDDELYAMDDDALDAAFNEAKSALEAGEVADTEQPTMDSDNAAVDTKGEEAVDTKEPDEAAQKAELDKGKPETATIQTEASTGDVDQKKELEIKEPTKDIHKFKANGQEFEFTVDEMKANFGKMFGQSMDYTKKMQTIAPWRKTISAMEENGITTDQINTVIDVLKGDKDAAAALLKQAGIDALDISDEKAEEYSPKNYGKSNEELELIDVLTSIDSDPEGTITQHVVSNQWDEASRAKLVSDPKMIQALHSDVKNGVYDKVAPMAMKMKIYGDGSKTDLEYYMEAGSMYYADLEQQGKAAELQAKTKTKDAQANAKAVDDAKKADATRIATEQASEARKAAATTKTAGAAKGVVDYLDDNDESFNEWYKQLEARS